MSVSRDDVRRVAELARVDVPDARLDALVQELNGILTHMEALRTADTREVDAAPDARAGMPLRPDAGPPVPLEHERSAMAPAMRDGFFLVPRLATHDAAGGAA
ncbi:MAG: Asp-tRNA(Asn)/Glu-tRNA(Gln) amidotransferase subunit GatC [Gemmatimonadetes bacterium]|nr:Asp-tRNA(Asn)/Glu-tRNA(Gln) amidotransferase subunit GatC [Gemmatimonadota bacterium]MBI3567458.1 Asp-tRNA(Asn)/Glu-tRNA(Gln) amidotransferase subunit GatC [Gemmatimonadota bacterium]